MQNSYTGELTSPCRGFWCCCLGCHVTVEPAGALHERSYQRGVIKGHPNASARAIQGKQRDRILWTGQDQVPPLEKKTCAIADGIEKGAPAVGPFSQPGLWWLSCAIRITLYQNLINQSSIPRMKNRRPSMHGMSLVLWVWYFPELRVAPAGESCHSPQSHPIPHPDHSCRSLSPDK